jgi:hypothetical protein
MPLHAGLDSLRRAFHGLFADDGGRKARARIRNQSAGQKRDTDENEERHVAGNAVAEMFYPPN